MNYDFCLGCGVLLVPQVYQCPLCGFSNTFDDEGELIFDDELLQDIDLFD